MSYDIASKTRDPLAQLLVEEARGEYLAPARRAWHAERPEPSPAQCRYAAQWARLTPEQQARA